VLDLKRALFHTLPSGFSLLNMPDRALIFHAIGPSSSNTGGWVEARGGAEQGECHVILGLSSLFGNREIKIKPLID
jgi:hypothetical protein